jgi:UDP-glucose:(heptosyl)LPS alpha-1,3-glucosyltransferase
MKIAMAIERFSVSGGGAESYAVELARKLVSEDWEVHLYGHSWDNDPESAVFHRISELPKWFPSSIKILIFALRHKAMIKRKQFDVILGFGNTITMNVYQSHGGVHYLSNMRKLRAVRNPIQRLIKTLALFVTPKYHARAWIESAPFRSPHRPVIIAISDMVRDDMAVYFGVDKHDIQLVYNGIDANRFSNTDRNRRAESREKLGLGYKTAFLFMAYDFRKKGVKQLIQAAGELRQRVEADQFRVLIVGGSPSPSLTKAVRRLDLDDVVTFHGPTKEPQAFYSACDVFVLPTFYDACSLVVFEAMAAGLPAITTVFNGASGIITHGTDGAVLQDPGNISEMADAMESFLDEVFLKTASAAAIRTASKYTLEHNHEQMMEIFDDVGKRL